MRGRIGTLLLTSAAMIVPAAAQNGPPSAAPLLQAADKAIGASSVKSLSVSGAGWMGYPGQQFAQGDLPRSDLKSYNVTFDFPSKSAKWDYVRVQGNNDLRGGGAGFPVRGEQRFIEAVNGDTAWNVNVQGQPVRIGATDAGDRELALWTNPIGFIQAALASGNANVTDRYYNRLNRTVKVVGFTTKVCDGPQPRCTRRVTGEFDDNNLLDRVITWVPDPVMGDKMIEFRFSDYRDVGGGVRVPFHLLAHIGDHPLIPGTHNWLELRVSDAKVNLANTAQAVPDAVRAAAVPTQNRVVSTTLVPGVVLIGGGSHNSVAVEFKDFVAVIEGPLNDERTNAVVTEVHKLFPGKPIRYLVNTHNHFDHLGGVRGFVAEGATVITDDRNRNFYEQVVLSPQSRTLEPDRLSEWPFAPTGPGTLALQTFTDRYTISDGNQTIDLYHVDGLNHSDNMLIAYLPKEKILINADLYTPPPPGGNLPSVNANAVALYRNIKRLKLDVARHVPIHGNPGPQADFERIVSVAYVQPQNIVIRSGPFLASPPPVPDPEIDLRSIERAMISCSERLRNNLVERAVRRPVSAASLRVEVLSDGGSSYTINLSGPSTLLAIGSPEYWEELSVQAFAFRDIEYREMVQMRVEIIRSRKNKSGGDPQPNPRLWSDMRPEDEGLLLLFQTFLSSQIRLCLQDKGP